MNRAGALIVGVGILLGCGNPSALNNGRSTQIAATDFEFAPATDTVAPGQNITFTFPSSDTATHNVTWDAGPPGSSGSGDVRPAGTPYTVYIGNDTTPTGSPYRYHCRFHGSSDGSGMAGTIVVTTH